MCGLNGIFAYGPGAERPSEVELATTRDHMQRRGPDGAGTWWSPDGRCGFGHRRLAIIDLSDRALQPMSSDDSALTIVFNGEIYNYPSLRRELEAAGRRFRTSSDTEALLHLYALYGREMVHKLRGMYAFAIWEAAGGGVFLARDPYGIKPLYTAQEGGTFRFASQVRALLAGGRVSRDPDPAGIVGFHLFGSVPEPFTLYRDVRALPAGHTQWIDAAGPREPEPFASLAGVLAQGASAPSPAAEFASGLRQAALDSVSAHLLADVEVGLFLSGGIDSGALLGLMRDAGQAKVRAITLSFDEFRDTADDEAPLAASTARLYGADHVVRCVTPQEFHDDLPAILDAMDQPSIDGVNSWFVAKAAREAGLKVALSGVGGDEVLAGYPSFRDVPRWVSWMRGPTAVPQLGQALRRLATSLKVMDSRPKAAAMAEYGGTYAGAYLLRRGLFLPFELDGLLDAETVRDGLQRLQPVQRLQASMTPDPRAPISRVSALESANYLRNQLLRDVDWAAMAHSVEVRTPFVDYTFLQALAPYVPGLKGGVGKRALAQAPSKPLQREVVGRAKMGFSVPMAGWASAAAPAALSRGLTGRVWGRQVFASVGIPPTP